MARKTGVGTRVSLSNEVLTDAYLGLLNSQKHMVESQSHMEETQKSINQTVQMAVESIQMLTEAMDNLKREMDECREEQSDKMQMDENMDISGVECVLHRCGTFDELKAWANHALTILSAKKNYGGSDCKVWNRTYREFDRRMGIKYAEGSNWGTKYQTRKDAILANPDLRGVYIQVILDLIFE